jgi:hypothetical protein
MNPHLLYLLMEQPAIQNLEFLRKLIAESKQMPSEDETRLRMIHGTGMGTDAMTTKKGDE